jgi:hypothetical protein
LSISVSAHPSRAWANGDPASDVLLAQDVFHPFQPKVSAGLEAAMNTALRAAAGVGLNLKVAIIGAPEELGVVPNLFGHPQAYAQFLDREISFRLPHAAAASAPSSCPTVITPGSRSAFVDLK